MQKLLLLALLLPFMVKASPNRTIRKRLFLNASADTLTLNPRFDFVPGTEVIYYTDFAGDITGELPAGWNTNGSGAVVNMPGQAGHWLQLHQSSLFLTDNQQPFGQDFTIEFDLLVTDQQQQIINFPAFYFGFLSSGKVAPAHNSVLQQPAKDFQLKVYPMVIRDGNGTSTISLQSLQANASYVESGQKPFAELEQLTGTPIHVAMQVQKERFRLWFNTHKVLDMPKAVAAGITPNQLFFEVSDGGYSNQEVAILVTNLKVAKGIVNASHQLLKEGTFSTSGILFDVGSSTIRHTSFGVLKEVATAIQQAPQSRFQIIGHTDADGSAESNMLLSQQRAESVRQYLVKHFGISDERLQPLGKGENNPVASNQTAAGKAQNRRVEFVLQKL
jgi:OmpA-OmpF porin, OOP family